jgi:carbonic anhydrase
MVSAAEALARLREGNQRVVSGRHEATPVRLTRSKTQQPVAIVLGCSDARVPAELVFGQGFGDLFVIRVAGNVVAPSQIGSVEFAAERFGTRLVVVLGHTECGAVSATVEELLRPTPDQSPGLRAIVDRIRPVVAPLLDGPDGASIDRVVATAVRANIRAAAEHLRHGSPILERLIQHGGLAIVGAEYCLETGVVDFFDGVPG